jgi:peptide/nickel transport system substrate-binding protein
MMYRWFVIALAVLMIDGCGRKRRDRASRLAERAEYGGTVVYAKAGPPITLDPALTIESESSILIGSMFDGLVEQRAGKIAIDPALAYRWEISDDGREYTFYLHSNVTFHDGTPFNASAVVASFQRQGDPKHPYHFPGADFGSWTNFGLDKLWNGIDALNDTVVRIRLHHADATFLTILSNQNFAVVSPAALEKFGSDFYRNPVGTGAFRFVSWAEDHTVTLVANENYYQGRPFIDSLIFKTVPDPSERWQMLKNGSITMMQHPAVSDMTEIEKTPGIKFARQPGLNVSYLSMNMKRPLFQDKRVREAIVLAIDRESLVKEVFGSAGRAAKNPLPPVLLGYNDEIRPTPYDPDRARRLLTEAGYPNGFKTTLWTMPITRDYMPDPNKAAQRIQRNLKAVGIDVEIKTFPWAQYIEKVYKGEHDLVILGWTADIPDPDNFFSPFWIPTPNVQSNSSNISGYSSAEMTRLINEGKVTPDPLERSKIYKQACAVFNEDLPWFVIAHSVITIPMSDRVMNFQLHSTSVRKFHKLWLRSKDDNETS